MLAFWRLISFHFGLLGLPKKSLRQQRRQNCRPAAKQEPYREKYVHHCLASQPFPLLGFAACCCSRPKHCKNKRCSLYSISSSRTERCSLQTFGSCSVRRRPHLEGGGVEVVHLARNHKKLLGKAIQDRIRILTVKKSKLSTWPANQHLKKKMFSTTCRDSRREYAPVGAGLSKPWRRRGRRWPWRETVHLRRNEPTRKKNVFDNLSNDIVSTPRRRRCCTYPPCKQRLGKTSFEKAMQHRLHAVPMKKLNWPAMHKTATCFRQKMPRNTARKEHARAANNATVCTPPAFTSFFST